MVVVQCSGVGASAWDNCTVLCGCLLWHRLWLEVVECAQLWRLGGGVLVLGGCECWSAMQWAFEADKCWLLGDQPRHGRGGGD